MEAKAKEFTWDQYAKVSFYGAVRGAVALPIEHPFDCVKTNMQAQPGNAKALTVTRQIYTDSGLRGFYKGYVPNMARVIVKQIYRWPMMLFLPIGLERMKVSQHSEVNKMWAAVLIAHFECFIITPLERLKVWLMTSYKSKGGLAYFFGKNRKALGAQLLAGIRPIYAKQIVSWVSFLVADDFLRNKARSHLNPDGPLDFWVLLIISVLVGLINTLCIMPFDCVKTHHQKNTTVKPAKFFGTFWYIYRTYGMKGMYAGWKVRFLHYIVHATFTVTILERLEMALK